jgi:C4-dicarboxylate-specific signal transduction histidine kinase
MDRDRIEQVLFNIISNAVGAMTGQQKKILGVTTNPSALEDCVQIIVSDTGTGIDHRYINRIFDPFFTTKDPAQGTGLGLFISYSIIKDHGGRIWAENDEWGGASFFIELPVARTENHNGSLERRIER